MLGLKCFHASAGKVLLLSLPPSKLIRSALAGEIEITG
jgi:hypothetical protein